MPPDPPKLAALSRILEEERDGGFQDHTVIGGLDLFLQRWRAGLKPALGDLGSYSVLTSLQREAWAQDVLARLGELTGPQGPAGASSARRRQSSGARKGKGAVILEDDVTRLKGFPTRYLKGFKRIGAGDGRRSGLPLPQQAQRLCAHPEGSRSGAWRRADGGGHRLGGIGDPARSQAQIDPGRPGRRHRQRPGHLVQSALPDPNVPHGDASRDKRKGQRLQGQLRLRVPGIRAIEGPGEAGPHRTYGPGLPHGGRSASTDSAAHGEARTGRWALPGRRTSARGHQAQSGPDGPAERRCTDALP